MQSPKVSVIMGVYNCEGTLPAAIESIIFQTYTNWELIVCDDGSTDGTFGIAEKYKKKYPEKIILLQNQRNSKLPATLNRCLDYASGEYTARMDGDDISYPERLSKQVEYLMNHPDIDLVGTAMTNFDGEKTNGYRKGMKYPNPSIIGLGTPFNHATIMMKTSVYKKLQGYSLEPYVIRCEDIDLWIRFFAAGYHGANLDDELYYVQEDTNAVARRKVRDGFRVSKMLWIDFNKYHYPKWQYVYILKPIISCLIPKKIKYLFNKNRWKKRKVLR